MELNEAIDLDFYNDKYGGNIGLDKDFINKNLKQAADLINEFCNFYFDYHSIDDLPLEQDKTNVKKALCAQLEHLFELGGNTELTGQNAPTGVQVGNFQMSGMKPNSTGMRAIRSEKALQYLRPTGLLYRGVGQW
ncbi:hypothetical protein [Companilactobacillus muriivasis]|uniref:hypothetical protein n=1 Tax=Companilactobacillus muriivasis TaxID=3081444 RepID=UPI0030C68DE5